MSLWASDWLSRDWLPLVTRRQFASLNMITRLQSGLSVCLIQSLYVCHCVSVLMLLMVIVIVTKVARLASGRTRSVVNTAMVVDQTKLTMLVTVNMPEQKCREIT